MKNNTQGEYFSAPFSKKKRSKQIVNQQDMEQRILYYRKAWQERTLNIDTPRLAQRIIDFETKIEPILPDVASQTDQSTTPSTNK
ncbi:hypothetical protein ACH42_02905 [Endozoicomonas sp. (ex Bugula neritina AB1)]|nr:hypothetical protein ACH42_02905 [Endozoicomonas sp. (ex Bugula neritina AB1)]